MAAQAGLCLARLETHEDTFCRDAVHILTEIDEILMRFLVVFKKCYLFKIQLDKALVKR